MDDDPTVKVNEHLVVCRTQLDARAGSGKGNRPLLKI